LLCVLALAVPGVTHASSDTPILLVLGDSLSAGYGINKNEGWVTLLEKKIKTEGYGYQVVNASITGETTGGGLSRLQSLLTQYKPDLLLIELGANDGLRGFPISFMNNNLDAMVKLAKQHHTRVLLVGVQLPFNYGPRYTDAFEKTFLAVSHTHKIPLVPSLLGKVPLDENLMQKDGLHPNAAAQPQLLQQVWPSLQPLLKPAASPQ
jgi:acyl-CoA thioesterase I